MGTHPIFESDFDCLTEFNEMTDELKKIKIEDKECEMKILGDKIIWNETTPDIINNAKNVLRKCHENRHVMRYALFAARAQIYRRIDDICNDIKNLDLVQKDLSSGTTNTLLELVITKMMSQRDILEDLSIEIRELLDMQCIHKWAAKNPRWGPAEWKSDCNYTDQHEPSKTPQSIFMQFFAPFRSSPMIKMDEGRPVVRGNLPE